MEPCAGDGRLVRHIRQGTNNKAQCLLASDIEPDCDWVTEKDALSLSEQDLEGVDMIITNPPWDRSKKADYLLHKIIRQFASMRPTWLLFDSDWMQTVQAREYMQDMMVATVSIGRMKWIEGSTMTGKDNCQWHLFHPDARLITKAPMHFGRGILPYDGFVTEYMEKLDLEEAA